MSPIAGPFFATALVLGTAGILKVLRPDPTRVALRAAGLPGSSVVARSIGTIEVAITLAAIGWGGRVPAALVAAAYLAFAGFSAIVRSRSGGRASCGCFGSSTTPLTSFHVVADLLLAAVALIAVADPVPGLFSVAADTPLAGVPFVAYTVLLAWLVQVTLTTLPELQAAVRQAPRATR